MVEYLLQTGTFSECLIFMFIAMHLMVQLMLTGNGNVQIFSHKSSISVKMIQYTSFQWFNVVIAGPIPQLYNVCYTTCT